MKRKVRLLAMFAVFAVLQACGGGGGGSNPTTSQATPPPADPPPATATVVTATPAIHFAFQGTNEFAVRTVDGSPASNDIVAIFSNFTANHVKNRTLPVTYTQPKYPLTIAAEPGYNYLEVKYKGTDPVQDSTNFVWGTENLKAKWIPYAAAADTAANPVVLPVIGQNSLVLLAPPQGGDYAPYVVVQYMGADGTIQNNFWSKPPLPFVIPLKAGFVKVTVATGTLAANNTFIEGPVRTWEYGTTLPTQTGGTGHAPFGDVIVPIN